MTKKLAIKLLKIRDCLIDDDVKGAYHILYSIACPDINSLEPWKKLETLAEWKDN